MNHARSRKRAGALAKVPMHPIRRLSLVVTTRPRLWSSVLFGLAVFWLVPYMLAQHLQARALVAWNAGALLYLLLAVHMIRDDDAVDMQRRALGQTEGRVLVLSLVVASAVAVLLAIGSQLAVVKEMSGPARTAHVALAALTLVTSWLFTQTLFALHYAHDYYLIRCSGQPEPLNFPGTSEPDYGDFLYFSCIIGTSGQTADVTFNGSALRPVGTLHCILAFFFNTTVLALTLNIAAGLF
jgi:uncharacterized membrane protein